MIEYLIPVLVCALIIYLAHYLFSSKKPPSENLPTAQLHLSDGSEITISKYEIPIFRPGDTIRYEGKDGKMVTTVILDIK